MIFPSSHPGHLSLMPTGIPAGAVIAFAGKITENYTGPPADFESMVNTYGWMVCDGRTLQQNDYPLLYHVLGAQYNTGQEKSGEFSIPDYRGYFLRMVDMGAGRDPDAGSRKLVNGTTCSEVGSIEKDALQTHEHVYNKTGGAGPPVGNNGPSGPIAAGPELSGTPTDNVADPPGNVRVSTETRPMNTYVYYIIKFV